MILYTIAELGDGCSQKEICEQVYVSKQTINSSIRKLEKEDTIRLEKGDRGRELHIRLTETGKKILQDKIYPVMEAENRAFIYMSAKDRAEFLRLSRLYVNSMICQTRHLLSEEEDI